MRCKCFEHDHDQDCDLTAALERAAAEYEELRDQNLKLQSYIERLEQGISQRNQEDALDAGHQRVAFACAACEAQRLCDIGPCPIHG